MELGKSIGVIGVLGIMIMNAFRVHLMGSLLHSSGE